MMQVAIEIPEKLVDKLQTAKLPDHWRAEPPPHRESRSMPSSGNSPRFIRRRPWVPSVWWENMRTLGRAPFSIRACTSRTELGWVEDRSSMITWWSARGAPWVRTVSFILVW